MQDIYGIYIHKRTLSHSSLVNDATLSLDNPLCFARNLLEKLLKTIMTIDEKVKDVKIQCNINQK